MRRPANNIRFYTYDDHPSREVGYATFKGSPCEREGLFLTKRLLPPQLLRQVQSEILHVIDVAEGCAPGRRLRVPSTDFQEQTQQRLSTLFTRRPSLRGPLVQVLRKLPIVQGLSAHPAILGVLRRIGLRRPVERINALQVFLPWEEVFRERPHQDFGDMLSEHAWTLQIPLHDIRKEDTGAAEIYPGTYRLGPLAHHLIRDPRNQLLYETTEPRLWRELTPKSFEMQLGDVSFFRCLNIHQTFPRQRRIRWSLVIRYDDYGTAPVLRTGTTPFAALREYDVALWNDQLQAFFKRYRVPAAFAQRAGSAS